jgi:hypothetical protein
MPGGPQSPARRFVDVIPKSNFDAFFFGVLSIYALSYIYIVINNVTLTLCLFYLYILVGMNHKVGTSS